MAKIPGLQLRGRTWVLRVRVPKYLQPHFKTQETIRTLETRDYDVAAKRVHIVRAGIEAEFEKERQKLKAMMENTDMLSGYSEHQLIALTMQWFSDIRKKQEKRRIEDSGAWTEDQEREYHIELQQEESRARHEKLGFSEEAAHDGNTAAAEFLRAQGVSYTNSQNFRKLGYFFTKAIHDLAQRNLREYEGKPHQSADFSATVYSPKKVRSMEELCKEYFNDPSKKRSPSTLKNYTIILRAIDEIIGNATLVHQVTREQCKTIRDLLIILPSNAIKKTKAKTLKEATRIAEASKIPVSADTTVNMHMQKLSAILKYAAQEEYIDRNPAKGLFVQEKIKSKSRRSPFDNEQLDKIFNAPLYTGCRDDGRHYNKPGAAKPKRARFWVPLISLWTGMRLNEICQLHVTDITNRDGIDIILIQTNDEPDGPEDEEKRVKTEAGTRFVPVHPMLDKLGFMAYVETQRMGGQKRLFPELKRGSKGDYGQGMSTWFRHFMKNIGAKKPRTAFHSFRHLYRDALRESEMPLAAILQLGGWSRGTTDDDYGNGLKPQTLYKHICKVAYPDLDLSHLYYTPPHQIVLNA